MEFIGMWRVRRGKRRGAYRTLVEKLEGKIPLVKPTSRWEDNIKLHIQKMV